MSRVCHYGLLSSIDFFSSILAKQPESLYKNVKLVPAYTGTVPSLLDFKVEKRAFY